MGTAVDDLVTLVRALIPEADPIEWPNARLIRHMDLEHKAWAAELGQLPGPGWFTVIDTFTLPANATEYDLTGLIAAADGQFAAVKSLFYLPTSGEPTRVESAKKGQEESFRLGVGGVAVGQVAPLGRWLTRPAGVPTLNMHPESSVARNFRGHFRYEPPTLASGDDVQTDPRHDDILVMGTALRALKEQAEDDLELRRDYLSLKLKFKEDERNVDGENESETTKVTESDAVFGGG